MSGNYVINIGRQLGSGGKEIGEIWLPRKAACVRNSLKKRMRKLRKV